MEFVEIVGYLAGTLTTIALLPQVLKTIRGRSTADISLGMYVLFVTGIALWLTYGILLSAWPIILSNLVGLILASSILILKIRNG
ncbi:MAG: SemiSWEET transporter [Acidobacteria bacterium]|nr:SemiSWEET transporter [Acidobacteriota bacterium]